MPDFVLPAEADRCVFCESIFYHPPRCCSAAMKEYNEYLMEEVRQMRLDDDGTDFLEDEEEIILFPYVDNPCHGCGQGVCQCELGGEA